MIYPYRCTKCKHEFDVIKSHKDIDRQETCDKCGETDAIRTIAKEQAFSKLAAGDWNTPHYNPALGKHFPSNSAARKEAKARGMEEIGNEPVEKIHKKYDNERKAKDKARWDSINTNLGELRS